MSAPVRATLTIMMLSWLQAKLYRERMEGVRGRWRVGGEEGRRDRDKQRWVNRGRENKNKKVNHRKMIPYSETNL